MDTTTSNYHTVESFAVKSLGEFGDSQSIHKSSIDKPFLISLVQILNPPMFKLPTIFWVPIHHSFTGKIFIIRYIIVGLVCKDNIKN